MSRKVNAKEIEKQEKIGEGKCANIYRNGSTVYKILKEKSDSKRFYSKEMLQQLAGVKSDLCRFPNEILSELSEIQYEELTKPITIAKILGYENFDNYDEIGVYPKGYRILNKIPRMPSNIVENLVESFKSFQHILAADIESLDDVDGIGEVRAKTIKQALKRMQEQFVFDNIII